MEMRLNLSPFALDAPALSTSNSGKVFLSLTSNRKGKELDLKEPTSSQSMSWEKLRPIMSVLPMVNNQYEAGGDFVGPNSHDLVDGIRGSPRLEFSMNEKTSENLGPSLSKL
ncbi:unnamed protein product [Prunus brigantina]